MTKPLMSIRLVDARKALQLGEFKQCLRAIEDVPAGPTVSFAEALCLRGRALLALDPIEAVSALKAGSRLISDFPAQHIETQVLLGRALAFTEQLPYAHRILRHALERARELGSERLESYASLNIAMILAMQSQFEDAEAYLDIAERDPDPLARAFALTESSFHRAAREDYAGQLVLVTRALECLRVAQHRDTALEATLTRLLAAVGVELCDTQALNLAHAQARGLQWTQELRDVEFQTYRALGLAAGLMGDHAGVYRYFRHAIDLAPTPAWKVVSHLALAKLLREYDTWTWEGELSHAHELAKDVEWQTIRGGEQEALLLFCELFARVDPAAATHYSTVLHTCSQLDARQAYRWDDRFTAHKQYAIGTLMQADGEQSLACSFFEKAWRIYDRIGYKWRAAETALSVATVCDPRDVTTWRSRAERIKAIAPKSWIAVRLVKTDAVSLSTTMEEQRPSVASEAIVEPRSAGITVLNRTQAKIRQLLIEGKQIKEIRELLSLSRRTATRHVATIRRLYGAENLNQLLATISRQASA